MINRAEHHVAWALLLQGLEDSRDHLEGLVKELSENPDYGEPEFRVDLGHVYAHLNRAWNSRNTPAEMTDEQWEQFTEFPKDLEPIG